VLVVMVVGIAIVLAGNIFQQKAAEANFDSVSVFLTELGVQAQKYYRTPVWLGGGGSSFVGLTANSEGIAHLTNFPVNDNGTFTILVAGSDTQVILQGVGTEDGDNDGSYCTMNLVVSSSDMTMTIISR